MAPRLLQRWVTVAALAYVTTNAADACAASPIYSDAYRIVISDDFTPEQLYDVALAVEEWHVRVGVQLVYDVGDVNAMWECNHLRNYLTICIEPAVAADFSRPRLLGETYNFPERGSASILLKVDFQVSDAKFSNTALHELGHAFGLDHTAAGDVMYMYTDAAAHLTCHDIQQYNALRARYIACTSGHYVLTGK